MGMEEYKGFNEIASVISFIINSHTDKNITYYLEEVPKDFKEPSIYFPTPSITSKNHTMQCFLWQYNWFIKVFDTTTLKAQFNAMKILQDISANRFFIQVVNEDGSKTDSYVKLMDTNLRKIDVGVMELSFRIDLGYFFPILDPDKIQKFITNTELKGE